MTYMSARSELVGTCVCLLVGAFVGCMALPFWNQIQWPTEEMISRGTAEGIYWGFFVAVPSGMCVCARVCVYVYVWFGCACVCRSRFVHTRSHRCGPHPHPPGIGHSLHL